MVIIHKTTLRKFVFLATVTAVAVSAFSGQSFAGSLENLERERASVIETMFSPELENGDRLQKLAVSKRRLVDLERQVLRDKTLAGKNTPIVRRAFANYDLTFLVHASVENGVLMTDQWMDQVGLSTHSILNARIGRR